MTKRKVPRKEDWGSLSSDPEIRYAFKLFGGMTIEQAMPLFIKQPIERAAELRFCSAPVFNYYIFCFADFLVSPASEGEADAASCFLGLVRDRIRSNAGVAQAYPTLRHAIETVSERQAFYDADQNIYGSFLDMRKHIESLFRSVSA